jgi:uncharacterized protein
MANPLSRTPLRWLRKLALVAVFTYILVVVIMCLLENQLVFRGQTAAEYWENPGPSIEEVTFPIADGVMIHAWHLPQPGSSETLLVCHGNGGNLSYRGPALLRFREHLNRSLLIFDYPGYGKSSGKPTESSCYESAEAALKWLAEVKHVPNKNVILYGESMGGGVAVEMAKRHDYRALVLMKTFTNLPSVAQRMYRWLPVKWLMRTQFDNLAKIGDLHRPVFISSADHDTLVPFEMGKQLYEAAREPKEFFPLIGEDHNDRVPDEFLSSLRRFLDAHKSPD